MNSIEFVYIKFKNCYWCLNQSIISLIWYRIFSKDIFFIRQYKEIKLWKLVFYKCKRIRGPKILKLSVYGQLCIPIYGGFKVFDFYEKNVIRIFLDVNSSKEFKKELKNLQKANTLKCAPVLKNVNINKTRYTEEYLKSNIELNKRKLDKKIIMEDFTHYAVPLLKEILLWEVPTKVNFKNYLETKKNIIESYGFNGYDRLKVIEIKKFFNETVQLLQRESNCEILIVSVHGDFCTKNIVATKSEIKLIDWELLKKCSVLHDFYNYFFHILRSSGNKMYLFNVIEESLNILNEELNVDMQNTALDLIFLSKIYRFLYYIERILSILEFRDNIHPQKRIKNLIKNICVFKNYENSLNQVIK